MSEISSFLARVYELLAESVAEVRVVTAAAPLPVVSAVTTELVITRARLDRSFTARPRYGVCHCCAGY